MLQYNLKQTTVPCKVKNSVQTKSGSMTSLLRHLTEKYTVEQEQCVSLNSEPQTHLSSRAIDKKLPHFTVATYITRQGSNGRKVHTVKEVISTYPVKNPGFKMLNKVDPKHEPPSLMYLWSKQWTIYCSCCCRV